MDAPAKLAQGRSEIDCTEPRVYAREGLGSVVGLRKLDYQLTAAGAVACAGRESGLAHTMVRQSPIC